MSSLLTFLRKKGASEIPVDVLYPPTFSFDSQQDGVTTINDAYNATNYHTYVFDITIPDPSTPPASNQMIMRHGVTTNANNYIWCRYRTTGSIQVSLRAFGTTYLDLYFQDQILYNNRLMRLAIVVRNQTQYEIYVNGRQYAVATSKLEVPTNADTRLHYLAAYGSDVAATVSSRMRYYDYELTRSQLEQITTVKTGELGVSYGKSASRIAIVGQGQSNMEGRESVGNKTIMPEVAAGRLKLLNQNLNFEDFNESWFDPDGSTPLVDAFAQSPYYAGYMGRAGNDLAASTSRQVVVNAAAQGGTRITDAWAGARTDLNTGAGATTAVGFLTLTLAESIRLAYLLANDVYVVHGQGESDALAAMTEVDYETQYNAYFDWLDYYYPNLHHFIVGLNAYNASSGATSTNWANINQARSDVATARANCTFIDVSDIVITNPDGLHYLNANQEIVGARIADAIELEL